MRKPWNRWPESLCLCLYASVVGFAISRHEPFADEAQAWQLARSLPLKDLFQTYIRYEGSPGLWHGILWILARAHIGYFAMHWIGGAVAVLSAGLLLFVAPFPRLIKLVLPFGYFLVFQYAVVARSYLLVPLLLFLLAIVWKKNPIVVSLLLGLLANTSLHAAAISGGLAIVYCLERIQPGMPRSSRDRRLLIGSAALLVVFYSFAIWTAWVPANAAFLLHVHRVAPPFGTAVLASLMVGICQPLAFSIACWISFALILASRRSLIFILPVLFFALFCAASIFSWWHLGLLTPLAIAILWIVWEKPVDEWNGRYKWLAHAAMVYAVAVQVLWAAYALRFDSAGQYSPDAAAAEFLKPYVQERDVIVSASLDKDLETDAFVSVGLQPYFDGNIFANQRFPFWWWSDKNKSNQDFNALIDGHPRVVVLEAAAPGSEIGRPEGERVEQLAAHGYRLTNLFCGSIPLRLHLGKTVCHLIYQSDDAMRASVRPMNPASAAIPSANSLSRASRLMTSQPDGAIPKK